MTTDFCIDLVYFAVLFVSSGYGIFHFRKMPAWLRAVTFICLLTLISEVIARILEHKIRNSCPPYHFYVVLCYLLLCYIYLKLYTGNRIIRYYCIITAGLLSIFALTNSIFIQTLLTFPSNSILLGNTFTLILTLSSFALMFRSPGKSPLLSEPSFWFNTANLLLYTTSFLYFAFYNILIASDDMPYAFQNVIAIFTILAYILYGISLVSGNKVSKLHDKQRDKQ